MRLLMLLTRLDGDSSFVIASFLVRWPNLSGCAKSGLSRSTSKNLDRRDRHGSVTHCRDHRAHAELSMTWQKFLRWKLLSLSARTSSLTVPNVLSGRCFIP
jgi:hypothetical protein